MAFGQRDDIGVVVDEDRGRGQISKIRFQRHAVPTAHDGRIKAAAALLVDGARQAEPDTVHGVLIATCFLE